jgi:hypothetical protein
MMDKVAKLSSKTNSDTHVWTQHTHKKRKQHKNSDKTICSQLPMHCEEPESAIESQKRPFTPP